MLILSTLHTVSVVQTLQKNKPKGIAFKSTSSVCHELCAGRVFSMCQLYVVAWMEVTAPQSSLPTLKRWLCLEKGCHEKAGPESIRGGSGAVCYAFGGLKLDSNPICNQLQVLFKKDKLLWILVFGGKYLISSTPGFSNILTNFVQ